MASTTKVLEALRTTDVHSGSVWMPPCTHSLLFKGGVLSRLIVVAFWALQAALVGALGLQLGCGGGSKGPVDQVQPVSITGQPISQSVLVGQSVTFTVTCSGSSPISFQWRKDGVAIANGTAASLTINGVATSDAAGYSVVATNPAGSVTSQVATLTVNAPPAITSQPAALTVTEGQPAQFNVIASGTGSLSYQWKKDGTDIPGATSSSHSISAANAAHMGLYRVVVSSAYGVVTSDPATLVVNAVTVAAPTILTQPTSGLTAVQGGTAAFSVTASGTGALSYQWTKGGANLSNSAGITGATSPDLSMTNLQSGDAGSYACVVTNTLNGASAQATSQVGVLSINLPPTITTQPSATQTVAQGGTATFTVAASGSGTLTYQWFKGSSALANAGNVAGVTGTSLVLSNIQSSDAGSYTCQVTNLLGGTLATATSGAGVLAVTTLASHFSVTGYPAATEPGASHTFVVKALDSSNNQVSTYTGTVHVSSTDPAALLPADYAFTIADAGIKTFSATLNTVGTQTLSVTDAGNAGIAGSLTGITVGTLAPTILTQPQTQTVLPPDPVTFTVNARANGGGSLSYAWKKNAIAIVGATGASYTVPSTELATNADAYSVTVTEGGFHTDSDTVYAYAVVTTPTYAGDPVPVPSRPLKVLPSLHADAVKYPNGAFRLGYDESLKNPVWTSYLNFPVHLPYANSSADYTADPRLDAPQVGKNDYTGIYTGGANVADSYDRGHQVPRADVSYRYTPVAGDDATIMSNLVPQISQFNQQTWQKLEDAIGGTSGGDTDGLTSFKGRLWVYTGSVFPASPTWWSSTVTPGLKIAIPVACYKIVVHEAASGQPEVLALLMPNVWGLTNSTSTLTSYVTSVARIEALTGLDFFPNLAAVAPSLDIPTWKATVDVRGWRVPFEKTTGPNVHMIQPSYDTTIDVGTTLTLSGAATPPSGAVTGTTIASTTWNFGDATPTTTGYSTSHTFTAAGSFNVTFSATDSLGSSNTITRVVKVVAPGAGVTAPAAIPVVLSDHPEAMN